MKLFDKPLFINSEPPPKKTNGGCKGSPIWDLLRQGPKKWAIIYSGYTKYGVNPKRSLEFDVAYRTIQLKNGKKLYKIYVRYKGNKK